MATKKVINVKKDAYRSDHFYTSKDNLNLYMSDWSIDYKDFYGEFYNYKDDENIKTIIEVMDSITPPEPGMGYWMDESYFSTIKDIKNEYKYFKKTYKNCKISNELLNDYINAEKYLING